MYCLQLSTLTRVALVRMCHIQRTEKTHGSSVSASAQDNNGRISKRTGAKKYVFQHEIINLEVSSDESAAAKLHAFASAFQNTGRILHVMMYWEVWS